MARTVYVCDFCERRYSRLESAESCESNHREAAQKGEIDIVAIEYGRSVTVAKRIFVQSQFDKNVQEYSWTRTINIDKKE